MSVAEFLSASDLNELAEQFQSLDPSAAYDPQVRQVLDAWSDVQALANLLMYPETIPDDEQVEALLQGLRDSNSYLRLAAAVGVGQLDPELIIDEDRDALAPALLAVIGQGAGVIASRAAASLARVGRVEDLDEAQRLIARTEGSTRHNLEWSIAMVRGEQPAALALLEYLPNLVDWQSPQ
jgi:hypothetical protein